MSPKSFLIPLLLSLSLFGVACSKSETIRQEAARVESELNEELSGVQVHIDRGTAPVIDGMNYIEDFVITIDPQPIVKPYFFGMGKYKIITGGDPEQIPTASICEVIDQRFESRVKSLESLRQLEGELSISFGGNLTLSATGGAGLLIDAIYAFRKILAIKNTRVLIAVRGYADGQNVPWSRPLEDFPYNYDTIRVLPPVDDLTDNPVSYYSTEKTIRIQNGRYGNALLPDLRAEFVRRELIIPFLQKCTQFRTDVRILKGFEYPETERPELRKVQVFVYLFEDES